jgi:hypothetical protein
MKEDLDLIDPGRQEGGPQERLEASRKGTPAQMKRLVRSVVWGQ